MTVSAVSRRVAYAGNGVTTTFAVPFQFFEIQVFANGVLMTPGVHYTVTQTTPGQSGSVTFLTPPAAVNVAIVGNTTATQALDLVDNDSAPAELYEGALDRLTMIAQENALLRGQSVRATSDGAELPALNFAAHPNSVLITDGSGVPLLANVNETGLPFAAPAAAAAASAVTATNAAATATSQANLAIASFDSFDDRYLGSKSSAPTLDNDGNTLLVGALYWDTPGNAMRVWNGTSWASLSAGGGTVTNITVGGGLALAEGGAITTTGNIRLANVPATTLKGNKTDAPAAPSDLTATEVTAMLDVATSSLKGLLAPTDKAKIDALATVKGERGGIIPSPAVKSYTLFLLVPRAMTVTNLDAVCASGSCTVALRKNGTAITGLTGSVTTTVTTMTASALNVFAAGDIMQLAVTATSAAADLAFSVKWTEAMV